MKMKIYTKTGDEGTTSLVGGTRVSKTSPRIEAYGTVDELNSNIGFLITCIKSIEEVEVLERVQRTLFALCSNLATDTTQTELPSAFLIRQDEIEFLEEQIDMITAAIPPQTSFVLPGGTRGCAQAHICRTVCRRAERRILTLRETVEVRSEILIYLNRLSDYLFILARKLNFVEGVREKIWNKTCR